MLTHRLLHARLARFMVTTFACNGSDIQHAGAYANMSAASAVLPDGAYTTFRTYDGDKVLRLAQHVRRLEESVALIGQPGPLDEAAVRTHVREVLRATRAQTDWAAPEARFRLTFAPPHLFISIEPFTPYPARLYAEGVKCVTVSLHRNNPQAKSTAFIASAADAYKQLPTGTHEGLMIGEDGAVLEGLSSNFFAVLPSQPSPRASDAIPLPDGEGSRTLHTEAARVLIGVTRSLVLEVAQPVLPISTQAISLAELPAISECFITSVSREILPVVQIDAVTIGDAQPGPITQTLMHRFAEMVQREAQPL
jgi:branched-chain amino acid aminotransferase